MKGNILYLFFFLFLLSCEKKEEGKIISLNETSLTKKVLEAPLFSGFLKPQEKVIVSFSVPGQIEKFPIKIGTKIDKGRMIAALDDHEYRSDLQKVETSFQKALVEKTNASSRYRKIKVLYESDSATINELSIARASFQSSIKSIEKQKTKVLLAKMKLSRTRIYAERDYYAVETKNSDIYENVKAGEVIATLSTEGLSVVELYFSEEHALDIYIGQKISIVFSNLEDQIFEGRVTDLGSSRVAVSPVEIVLEKTSPELKSGMVVKTISYTKKQ